MWLSIISALIGLLGSTIPRAIAYFERKQEIQYELEITRLKVEGATRGYEISRDISSMNTQTLTVNDARKHDLAIDGGSTWNQIRAAVRPVITIILFSLWLFVKVFIIAALIKADTIDVAQFSSIVMDEYTLSLLMLVMGFWFGSRGMEKLGSINKR